MNKAVSASCHIWQLAKWSSWAIFFLALAPGSCLVLKGFNLFDFPELNHELAAAPELLNWPASPGLEQNDFIKPLFVSQVSATPQLETIETKFAGNFRLAGTFFAAGDGQQTRRAILDDLNRHEQCLVSEGDMLENSIEVYRIFTERIILRVGEREEELRLVFSKNIPPPGSLEKKDDLLAEKTALMLNRFGRRVGESRWILKRDELTKYYSELLNDTERLAKVFDSLKPVYQGDKIAGYALIVEGEAEMFNAFGLKPHDTIRAVNKMPMTNRNRAEFFIREFVGNRLNAFVLDIERAGKPEQMIYLIR